MEVNAEAVLRRNYEKLVHLRPQISPGGILVSAEIDQYLEWKSVLVGSDDGYEPEPGARQLFRYLENETCWLKAPASIHYHGSHDGGLVRHSVLVTTMLRDLCVCYHSNVSAKTIAKVGLLHDLGKIEQYQRVNDEWWEWRDEQEMVSMPHSVRSLLIASRYIEFQDFECQAVLGHDGQYVDSNRSMAMKEGPLTLLLHWSDVWCSRFREYQGLED